MSEELLFYNNELTTYNSRFTTNEILATDITLYNDWWTSEGAVKRSVYKLDGSVWPSDNLLLPPGKSIEVFTLNDSSSSIPNLLAQRTVYANYQAITNPFTIIAIKNTEKSIVIRNSSDQDNDPLTYTITENPKNGTAQITNGIENRIIYTPNNDFIGTDTIKYQANDGIIDSNISTITVKVLQYPVTQEIIINDAIEDTPKNIIIQGSQSIEIVDPSGLPIRGNIQVTGNQITYTPNNNYVGSELIIYKIVDTDHETREKIPD